MASAILALVSIGLLVSLLPRTSFVSRAANEIVDAVGPVRPDASVEQVLDQGQGPVSEVRIWAATGPDRGDALIVAGLLQGSGRELVRQVAVRIHASKLLQPYVLEFPPYRPVPGEASILQLWVSNERSNYAIFGTSARRDGIAGLTLNLNPTDQGPLAYELIWRGDGWRAALEGSWLDRLRLAGGIAAAALAVLLRPPVARRISKALRRVHAAGLVAGRSVAGRLRLARSWLDRPRSPTKSASRPHAFYLFPWLIPAFAILHFLANNLVILPAQEAIVPSAVIMAGTTVAFIALRLILKGSASAAILTGVLGVAYFSYGHVYVGLDNQADSRFLLGLGIPAIIGVGLLLRKGGRSEFVRKICRTLNYATAILIVLPLYQIVLVLLAANTPQESLGLKEPIGLDERVANAKLMLDPDGLSDIYYFILDGYPRSGSPASFDNSEFIGELESRGFYVDPQARSNYLSTRWSTMSSLNMTYIHRPIFWHEGATLNSTLEERYLHYNTTTDHLLGRVLTDLGYKYIHVSSGWFMTATSRSADIVVNFTPSGRQISGYVNVDPISSYQFTLENAIRISNEFMRNFLQTTLMKHVDSASCLDCSNSDTYDWSHPFRALEWLDYMSEVAVVDGPKFVFGHLLKPHYPYSFDRHGNVAKVIDEDGNMMLSEWSHDHDPTVENALHGQIIWLNGRLLQVVDAILDDYEEPPIIVIMSDHGRRFEFGPGGYNTHDIFAAYLLPRGGDSVMYPNITSVNIFRVILDYYFELGLGRLDDVTICSDNLC